MEREENYMNTTRFKKLEWSGNDPKGIMTSYTTVFQNNQIGFRIMNCADGKLRLIDFANDMEKHIVNSVEDGKRKAQELFDKYCMEILHNIYQ